MLIQCANWIWRELNPQLYKVLQMQDLKDNTTHINMVTRCNSIKSMYLYVQNGNLLLNNRLKIMKNARPKSQRSPNTVPSWCLDQLAVGQSLHLLAEFHRLTVPLVADSLIPSWACHAFTCHSIRPLTCHFIESTVELCLQFPPGYYSNPKPII